MTNRERFNRVLNFEPVDRLPVLEWAGWWDKTLTRWYAEGLPAELTDGGDIRDYFGQDCHRQYWIAPPGRKIVATREEYLALKPTLYPEHPFDRELVKGWAKRQKTGEMAVWMSLEGPFWFPRTLLGIENHLLAFYDQPDLMKEMNEDILAFNLRVYDEFCDICVPDFMSFAEDMSYNHGPMLSKALFDEFMAPFYRKITPIMRQRGTVILVDTDGNITEPASWFLEVGCDGLLPLERMAGVDVSELRRRHPRIRLLGAFDKTVMHLGEVRMRQEFERLLPVMKQGGFIPSVDHQTPPGVSLEDYRLFMRLLKEYCRLAAGK
jgi:uroporphyrinogen-III decarboxylase